MPAVNLLGMQVQEWRHIEAIFCDEPEFGLHCYISKLLQTIINRSGVSAQSLFLPKAAVPLLQKFHFIYLKCFWVLLSAGKSPAAGSLMRLELFDSRA
jgi:hypothetical protein